MVKIMPDYKIQIYENINYDDDGKALVGCVVNNDSKSLMDIYLIKDCVKRYRQNLFSSDYEKPLKKRAKGYSYISELYFDLFIKKFTFAGKVLLMHELSHVLNGDNERDLTQEEYTEMRKNLIRNGEVDPCELKADKFAITECGIDAFKNTIDLLIKVRKMLNIPNDIGIKELELRKELASR